MMSAPMISFSLAASLATASPFAIATSLPPIVQIADAADNVNAQDWPLVTSDSSCQGKPKRKKRTKAKSNTADVTEQQEED